MTEGESAFVLLAELSVQDESKPLPVIACSGDPDNLDRAQRDSRFGAVFPKPFAISALITAVNALTGTAAAEL
jgi:hypothetical protein